MMKTQYEYGKKETKQKTFEELLNTIGLTEEDVLDLELLEYSRKIATVFDGLCTSKDIKNDRISMEVFNECQEAYNILKKLKSKKKRYAFRTEKDPTL